MVAYLRRKLGVAAVGGNGGADGVGSVFCYVNSVFAPGLDEVVGNLHRVSCLGGVVVESYFRI